MHLVPALIEHNGPAAVSAYFQPQPTGRDFFFQCCAWRCICSHSRLLLRPAFVWAAPVGSAVWRCLQKRHLIRNTDSNVWSAGAVVDGLPVLACSLRGRSLPGVVLLLLVQAPLAFLSLLPLPCALYSRR